MRDWLSESFSATSSMDLSWRKPAGPLWERVSTLARVSSRTWVVWMVMSVVMSSSASHFWQFWEWKRIWRRG